MKPSESVLSQYRTADEGERMYLYLQYRQLRASFSQIEAEDEGAWADESPIVVSLPSLAGLLTSVRNVVRGLFHKQKAPIRH